MMSATAVLAILELRLRVESWGLRERALRPVLDWIEKQVVRQGWIE